MIIINGLGCLETGARLVLKWFLESYSDNETIYVVVAKQSKAGLPENNEKIRYLIVSHRIFGRWLRIPFEALLGILAVSNIDFRIINMSHYGICVGGRYSLYMHSLVLFYPSLEVGWDSGKTNFIKQWMLRGCVRNCEVFAVQSTEMLSELMEYKNKNHIVSRCVEIVVVPPPFPSMNSGSFTSNKLFSFQLFYPCSRFPHKQSKLAIQAVESLVDFDEVGLIVTSAEIVSNNHRVIDIGQVSHQEIASIYKVTDALLFTSEKESLGLPLLEALALGLPAVIPRLPYAESIYSDAGVYFDDFTPQSIARAIVDLKINYKFYKNATELRRDIVNENRVSWSEQWRLLNPVDFSFNQIT